MSDWVLSRSAATRFSVEAAPGAHMLMRTQEMLHSVGVPSNPPSADALLADGHRYLSQTGSDGDGVGNAVQGAVMPSGGF